VKRDWESIADKLSKAGWSWGCVSTIDSKGCTIWIVDAQRDDGKRGWKVFEAPSIEPVRPAASPRQRP